MSICIHLDLAVYQLNLAYERKLERLCELLAKRTQRHYCAVDIDCTDEYIALPDPCA